MANKWTVAPQTVRKDLEDPRDGEKFWISIKKLLTVGEDKSVKTAGLRGVSGMGGAAKPGEEREMSMQVDWKRQSFARTESYLVDWSLATSEGVKLKVQRDVIESLDPEVYDVIEAAITKHVEEMDEEKKARTGELKP